jgi:hypothetical protein
VVVLPALLAMSELQGRRVIDAIAALVLAAWLDFLITIEWSYPYCAHQTDGPAYPAVGFPFPYATASPVSSMEVFLMPQVLALDLLLVAAALYPLMRALHRALINGRVLSRTALAILVVLGIGIVALRGVSLSLSYSVASIGDPNYMPYSDFRPVGVTWSDVVYSKRACKPSRFWFPESS